MSSEGTPLHGDRSAYNVMDFDTEHAKDIMDSTLRRHLPLPGAAGGYARSDGADWQRVDTLTLADFTATQIGQVVFSIDGAGFSAQLPLTGEAGWLVEEINGVLLVVDTV